MRTLIVMALVLAAGTIGHAADRPDLKYAKRDLAASYKPLRVQGVDWYRTVGAARLKAARLLRADRKRRLILQMRMLGPMDGPT